MKLVMKTLRVSVIEEGKKIGFVKLLSVMKLLITVRNNKYM